MLLGLRSLNKIFVTLHKKITMKRFEIMKIKVSGICVPENVSEMLKLGVYMVSLDFRPQSERFVRMRSSNAGIIPDYSDWDIKGVFTANETVGKKSATILSGIFADDMPQTILTRIYNYKLGCVELAGSETVVMIENLCRTVVPDICGHLLVFKHFDIVRIEDFEQCRKYFGIVDGFVFNMDLLPEVEFDDLKKTLVAYVGDTPCFFAGRMASVLLNNTNVLMGEHQFGVDLREEVEVQTGVVDHDKLKTALNMQD